MSDTISRQAAIAYAISGRVRTLPTSEDGENWIRTEDVRQSLSTMPSAQPERKKGKWILECDAEGEGDNLYRCPECGCNYSCQEYDIPNFCPNCGSYNRGENYDKG